MKKITVFCVLLGMMVGTGTAYAADLMVSVAVPLASGGAVPTCSNRTAAQYTTNWNISCESSVSGKPKIQVRGIAMCADAEAGVQRGDPFTNLNLSPGNNIYCYCRMTSPWVSKWIYMTKYASNDYCFQYCVTVCGSRLTTTSTTYDAYKKAMFNSLNWLYD